SYIFFFFSSRRRHTRSKRDWSSDVCSSDLSTYSNAERTIEIMEDNNFESAMIVTSDYHLKRTKLAFERLNDNENTFNYISASNRSEERRVGKECKSRWGRHY